MKDAVINSYSKVFYPLFFIFLFLTFSFGRAFSILHIPMGETPLFVTEIILLFGLPVIIANFKAIFTIPNIISLLILAYFLLGFTHLLVGITNKNFYALRDAVLCIYILFFYLSFIIFSDGGKLKVFLFIILISNIVNIFVGQVFISDFRIVPNDWKSFLITTKIFNLCLYYGLTLSFLVAYLNFINDKQHKVYLYLLGILNLYVLLFLSSRTAWVACIFLGIYFILILRVKFLKNLSLFILSIIVIFGIFHYINPRFNSDGKIKNIILKTRSSLFFIKNSLCNGKKEAPIAKAGTAQGFTQEPSSVSDIFSGTTEEYDNLRFRSRIWKTAFEFGLEKPFLGNGFGIYPVYLNWDSSPMLTVTGKRTYVNSGVIPTHNHLVSIFYKMGLLGFCLFLFINISVFVYSLNYLQTCKHILNKIFLIGGLGGIVFWNTMALFFDVIDSPPTSIFLWILIGLVLACIEADKKSGERKNKMHFSTDNITGIESPV